MTPETRVRRVKQLARDAGFDLARITSALPDREAENRYVRWVEAGRHGAMRWITPERARRSCDPSTTLPRARSVICLALAYWAGHRPPPDGRRGAIARYAWGRDYHTAMAERLERLASTLASELGGEYRWYVDTGPVMERAFAARAGIGWYGKNANILTEQHGSFVLLAEILTTLELPADPALARSCGSCRLCVMACPTGAIGPEHSIDSRKCISYLTIEHRGPIARELRSLMGAWVFGCDICQDVCPPTMERYLEPTERGPWARQVRSQLRGSATNGDDAFPPLERVPGHPLFDASVRPTVDLVWLLKLQHTEYLEHFRDTSIRRAKVWMLRRNAAIALGNVAGEWAVAPLSEALAVDDEPVVRGHAAWALGRIAQRLESPSALSALAAAAEQESNEGVREEIAFALAMSQDESPMVRDTLGH